MRSLTKAIYISYARQEIRVRLLQILVAVSIISVFVYIYSVMNLARNAALSQGLERKIEALSSRVESLEFAKIEIKNNITLELASEMGFKEVVTPLYVSRGAAPSLSFNTMSR